jgi:hypothetical protein
MKYRLCDWEENGYHDSYGYIAYWNDETNQVEKTEYWATAYGGGMSLDSFTVPPTIEVVMSAVEWLKGHIYAQIRAAEHRDVLEPNSAKDREDMVLLRDVKHKGVKYAAGTCGRVFWSGAYGKFYRNGYNRPCRSNIRVGLELTSGERIYVALSALRYAKEPMSDSELMARAGKLALDCQFGKALSGKHAWDAKNWAAELLAKQKQELAA